MPKFEDFPELKAMLFHATHALKTPLHGILGNSNLLRENSLSSTSNDQLDEIHDCGKDLLQSIEQLSFFLQHMCEENSDKSDIVDINQLIKEIYAKAKKSSSCKVHLNPIHYQNFIRLFSVEKFKIIFKNLLENICCFSENNEIDIDINYDFKDSKKFLKIKIIDRGIKNNLFIQTLLKESILEKKHQKISSGVVFNILLSKILVQCASGEINPHSTPGTSDYIEFILPIEIPEKPAIFKNIQSQTAFILDSNIEHTIKLKEKLNKLGIFAHCANTPIEAIRKLRILEAYDVQLNFILTDFLNSCVNGVNLNEIVKSIPKFKNTPIIYLNEDKKSNHDSPQGVVNAELHKPVNTEQLFKTISHILNPKISTPKTILLVEDNPVNAKIARKMISKLGHNCETAVNGAEAVHTLKSTKFDLIFMDIDMPIMNGIEATLVIRNKNFLNYSTPIYALSANTDPKTVQQCLDSGMNGFICKPFDKEELNETISKTEVYI